MLPYISNIHLHIHTLIQDFYHEKKTHLTNINTHSDHLPVDSKKHSHIIESDLYQMVEKNYSVIQEC